MNPPLRTGAGVPKPTASAACASRPLSTAVGRLIGTVTVLASLVISGCSGAAPPPEGERPPASTSDEGTEWTIVLDDLELGPSGIGLALHPRRTPIVVAADSDIALEVCPADGLGRPADPARASFGRRWRTCLPLGDEPVALPETDGRSHVGIRILSAGRTSGRVSHLRVRWRCADDYLLLQDPTGRSTAPVPRCGPSVPQEVR